MVGRQSRASCVWPLAASAFPPIQWIKHRVIYYTSACQVFAVLDLLAAAEVQVWVVGGSGVDALLFGCGGSVGS